LAQTHTDLCTTILKEEDALIEAHRLQVDATMQIVKKVTCDHFTFINPHTPTTITLIMPPPLVK
jgi:hypothetical protein